MRKPHARAPCARPCANPPVVDVGQGLALRLRVAGALRRRCPECDQEPGGLLGAADGAGARGRGRQRSTRSFMPPPCARLGLQGAQPHTSHPSFTNQPCRIRHQIALRAAPLPPRLLTCSSCCRFFLSLQPQTPSYICCMLLRHSASAHCGSGAGSPSEVKARMEASRPLRLYATNGAKLRSGSASASAARTSCFSAASCRASSATA